MKDSEFVNRSNQLSGAVIGAAIDVHKSLGSGLYESVYEHCLAKELQMRGIHCEQQLTSQLNYKGKDTGQAFRIDMLVEDELVVELKAVDELTALNEVQLVTYLKLLDKHLGLLINFNVERLTDGVRRRVNNLGLIVSKSQVDHRVVCTKWTGESAASANSVGRFPSL